MKEMKLDYFLCLIYLKLFKPYTNSNNLNCNHCICQDCNSEIISLLNNKNNGERKVKEDGDRTNVIKPNNSENNLYAFQPTIMTNCKPNYMSNCFYCENNLNYCSYCFTFDSNQLIKCHSSCCTKYFHKNCLDVVRLKRSLNDLEFKNFLYSIIYKNINEALIINIGDLFELLNNENELLKIITLTNSSEIYRKLLQLIELDNYGQTTNTKNNDNDISKSKIYGCIDHTCSFCFKEFKFIEQTYKHVCYKNENDINTNHNNNFNLIFIKILQDLFESLSDNYLSSFHNNNNNKSNNGNHCNIVNNLYCNDDSCVGINDNYYKSSTNKYYNEDSYMDIDYSNNYTNNNINIYNNIDATNNIYNYKKSFEILDANEKFLLTLIFNYISENKINIIQNVSKKKSLSDLDIDTCSCFTNTRNEFLKRQSRINIISNKTKNKNSRSGKHIFYILSIILLNH